MTFTSSKQYSVGDVVFEGIPIIYVVDDEMKGYNCDYCLKGNHSLMHCSKCHEMHYCDKTCQQKDWKYHKNECEVYASRRFRTWLAPAMERLLIRLYLCSKADEKFGSRKYPHIDGSQVCLNDVLKNIKDTNRSGFHTASIHSSFCMKFKRYDMKFNSKEMFRYTTLICSREHVLSLRSFSGVLTEVNPKPPILDDIGMAVFLSNMEMRHSCHPNTVVVTKGSRLQVRVVAPIALGETLTVCLVSPISPKETRNQQILERCGYECSCRLCQLETDRDIDYEEFHQLYEVEHDHWNNDPIKARKINKDYKINYHLFMYLRAICGEHSLMLSTSMISSFCVFAQQSRLATRSLISLWYNHFEPSIRFTFGSEHLVYKYFQLVYEKSLKRRFTANEKESNHKKIVSIKVEDSL